MQAFEVNFWNNVRGQNRCGQCHNATTPAQMPNFARSDNVNLAYAQANTVVNLAQPSDLADRGQGERRAQLLARGQQRLRPDPDHLDQQLGRRHRGGLRHAGAVDGAAVQSVGQSLNFPGTGQDYQQTIYSIHQSILRALPFLDRGRRPQQSPFFADPQLTTAYQAAIPKIDLTGCSPFIPGNTLANQVTTRRRSCGTNSRFYQRLLDR